jgi:hypothetical protein
LLKLIEALVPEPFVLMQPSCDIPKRLTSERYEDLTTLFSTFDEPSSLEQLQVFRHRV